MLPDISVSDGHVLLERVQFNELKRQGGVRYTKKHKTMPGQLVKPLGPGKVFALATVFSPVLAAIVTPPLALGMAFAILRMFDWGLLD